MKSDEKQHPTNATLPFDDLPDKITLHQVETTRAKVQVLLDQIDWSLYERNVIIGVREAIHKYAKLSPIETNEKVAQVSLLTDVWSLISIVSFDTRQNAIRLIDEDIQFCAEERVPSENSVPRNYNDNPADFKYTDFHKIMHPELSPLKELNFDLKTHLRSAEKRVQTSLKRVVREMIISNLLKDLPTEPYVWVGISSPNDWYDYVQLIHIVR